MGRIDRSTSQFLDAARWMAALAVVLSHVSALLIVDDNQVPHPGPALQALFYLKNCGHLAVVIFFVLSGYLVGGQEVLRIIDGRRFDPLRYGIQRFSRIYTVLVPALLLTALLDNTGQWIFNHSELYTNPAQHHVGSLMYPIAGRDGLGTFVGNLLMLQTIAVEPFGSAGPLWSLANEWWYYVMFGLVLIVASQTLPVLQRGVAGAAVLVLPALLPVSINAWFTLWLLGVGAAVLGRSWRGLPFRAALVIMLAGFALSLLGMARGDTLSALPAVQQNVARLLIDAVAAVAFAVALLSVRNRRGHAAGRLHHALAGFSYTLYAVHFPLLIFLAAAGNVLFGLHFGQPLGAASLATVALFTAVIASLAWAFAAITEQRTAAVRDSLSALLTRRREAR